MKGCEGIIMGPKASLSNVIGPAKRTFANSWVEVRFVGWVVDERVEL